MTKKVNYEQEVVLLIESKNSFRVAKPNAFETSRTQKSIGFRSASFSNVIVGETGRCTDGVTLSELLAQPNLQELSPL